MKLVKIDDGRNAAWLNADRVLSVKGGTYVESPTLVRELWGKPFTTVSFDMTEEGYFTFQLPVEAVIAALTGPSCGGIRKFCPNLFQVEQS
jgi:hypothetical protein